MFTGVITGDAEESSWITVIETRYDTRCVTETSETFIKFGKIDFVLHINYKWNKTHLETVFFYFLLNLAQLYLT